jgi:hypothetical protein
MRSHPEKLPGVVILIGAKNLTSGSLITFGKQRDTNSVGAVPHFVRDDALPMQRGLFLTRCT